ncbi:MAG: hypothetical protein NVS3B1_07800 [Marmoricola sp.]
MARGRLTSTPSGGQSEVLETLLHEGGIRSGVQTRRLVIMVSQRYAGDNNRALSDPVFIADAKAVIAQLAVLGYVTGFDPTVGSVDLTASQPDTAFVALTGTGRAQARHPRPRPRAIRG